MPAPSDRQYYVYVYIDPRNFEEFYYGKGKGSRRTAHLDDAKDSEKTRRIAAIRNEGLAPIIKTIAAGLTEHDAHLIETTLIWRLGRTLTNLAAGHYASLFRPPNSLHKQLSDFDFQNAVWYFNVGEGHDHRRWENCQRLGFVSAGGGARWRDQVLDISPGDVLVAYLKKNGFVGVGKVTHRARPYSDVRIKGKLLHEWAPGEAGMVRGVPLNVRFCYPWHWRASVWSVHGKALKSVETHEILGGSFCREFGQLADVAKKSRKRRRIDALIDAHVWMRRQAAEGRLTGPIDSKDHRPHVDRTARKPSSASKRGNFQRSPH